MTKKIALAAALSALSFFATRQATAWTPLDSIVPRWPSMPVGYYVNQATIPGSISAIGVARIDQGFATWSAPACTVWLTQNLGNTNLSYNAFDNNNVFRWISGSWPGQLGNVNSVIGVTMPVWNGDDTLDDADIAYNNVGFCWNDSGSGGCVDTLSIITHEEGHFLGLGHTNVSGATMEAFYPGGQTMRTIEQDDINGVCALYPPGGTTATSTGNAGGDCQTCVNGSVQGGPCASQYNACGSSPDCIAFYDCATQCGSQSCIDGCAASYPTGAQIYTNLVNCICGDCAVECATECGGSSSSSTTSTTSASAGAAGAGGSPGAGGSGGGTNNDDDYNVRRDPGCTCSFVPAPLGVGGSVLLALFGALATRRRNRSRRSSI